MDDDELETGRSGAMIDKEALERLAMQGGLKPNPRVCMYRLGESRIFEHKDDIPEGEGWVDSPAKVRPMPQIKPAEAVSPLKLVPTPEIKPESGGASRGRKRKAAE